MKRFFGLFLVICFTCGCLISCKQETTDTSNKQSTNDCPFEWVGCESGHYIKVLCDCCTADSIIYEHIDYNRDGYCDDCRYLIGTYGADAIPEDFAFSLTWNTYGISSYDSQTGLLIKTSDVGSEPQEDYQVTYFLTDDQKAEIYGIICDLGVENYPDEYNPNEEAFSDPSQTLILNVKAGTIDKTVTAEEIAVGCVGENEKGQKFLDAINAIVDILTATDEWKALPDYPYLYD